MTLEDDLARVEEVLDLEYDRNPKDEFIDADPRLIVRELLLRMAEARVETLRDYLAINPAEVKNIALELGRRNRP